jgi:sec-independent protein translocase protein TatB
MFDIGWSEMAIIMLVALVVIGPRDLPRLARTLGQWVAKGRAMAREFQRSLEDMAREAELDDVRREIEKVGRTNIKKSIEKAIDPSGDLATAFDPSSSRTPAKAGAAANGEAKPPAPAEPEPEAATVPALPEPTAEPIPAAGVEPAPPKVKAKAKAAAKPRAATRPKAAPRPKPKPAAETASTPAPSRTGNGAGPG